MEAVTSYDHAYPQAIQALPARAGSVIAFSHRLLHWGSRASASAAGHPRMALSFAFAAPEFEAPYLPDAVAVLPLPPFELRLALVAGQLFSYAQQSDLGDGLVDVLFALFCTRAA